MVNTATRSLFLNYLNEYLLGSRRLLVGIGIRMNHCLVHINLLAYLLVFLLFCSVHCFCT